MSDISSDRESDRSATALIVVTSVFLGFAVITTSLRFYARRRQKAAVGLEDWSMLPGLAAFASACICLYYTVSLKGLGYSTGDVPKAQLRLHLESVSRSQLGLGLSSIFCLTFTKASALLFYKRIFCVPGRKRILESTISATIVLLAFWLVVYELLLAFQCHEHFDAPWKGTTLKYCDLSYPVLLSQSISDVILDIWVVALPIYPVMQLQITPKRKLAIISIFLLASVGVASSIARMVVSIQLNQLGHAHVHNIDPGRYVSRSSFYLQLEMGVSVVAVNLPSIWPLFTSITAGALLRSARGLVSLRSVRSKSGIRDSSGDSEHLGERNHSKSPSKTSFTSISASATIDSHKPNTTTEVLANEILISQSVEQSMSSHQHQEA